MPAHDRIRLRVFALLGLALLYAQQVERAIEFILNTVLRDPSITVASLASDAQNKEMKTLGYFLKELRKHTRIERTFNQKLYKFLSMRNTLIHNLHEVPGWNLETEEGQETSLKFLLELISLAVLINGVLASLLSISMREEFGEELGDKYKLLVSIEQRFGETGRSLFLGMNRKRRQRPTDNAQMAQSGKAAK